jgi:two-component system nitrate/nitrite response regulator NarL
MDALDVFYRVRHQWPEFAALMTSLRYVFATGSRTEALAVVHSQCSYVMRHHGHRPAGRAETGSMIGAVTTAAEALDLCERHALQILITTDQLEDGDGLALVREAHHRWPQLPILLMLKQLSVPRMRLAMESGSQGILTDALIFDGHVFEALQGLLRGERYLDPALGSLIARGAAGPDVVLSAIQLQVLRQLVLGDTDRVIANQLDMSFDMVRYYVRQIYAALGVSNRSSAAAQAVKLGLVDATFPKRELSPDAVQRLLVDLKAPQDR